MKLVSFSVLGSLFEQANKKVEIVINAIFFILLFSQLFKYVF
jgi:hypothetical protein